ncbi:MAG: hypothetical protein NXH72_14265 [Hyphomonadaceae bacterium]|nr:hypothetical protein [Hyphomonadaceae bacterium]
MARVLMASLASVWLAACATTPEQIAEAEILATWDQFEAYYNDGDVEGVKSLLYIEGLDEAAQDQVEAETNAMANSSAWMMSPNVGMQLDADVKVRRVEGDEAVLDGTLTQIGGQSVFFSMKLARIDGTWLLAPAGGPSGNASETETEAAPASAARL